MTVSSWVHSLGTQAELPHLMKSVNGTLREQSVEAVEESLVWKEIQVIHHLQNINVTPQVPITRRGTEAAVTRHRRRPRVPALWGGTNVLVQLQHFIDACSCSRINSTENYAFVEFISHP